MIRRRGYNATRRGTRYHVKAKYIADRGARGRWQSVNKSTGIGTLRKGELKNLGYDATTKTSTRHAALDKAVKKYGRNSTIRKLNAIATYTKRVAPSRSRTYRTDMHYIQKKY